MSGRRSWLAIIAPLLLSPNGAGPTRSAPFFGGDWATYKSEGVLIVPDCGTQLIFLVAPDGVAAERGIRAGDRLPEDALPETLVGALREGSEIVVVRRNQDELWIDTVRPPPEAAVAEAP
jgi:hypothetical protein